MSIGANIRRIREEKGLKQVGAAKDGECHAGHDLPGLNGEQNRRRCRSVWICKSAWSCNR